jgi:hypothetical protein
LWAPNRMGTWSSGRQIEFTCIRVEIGYCADIDQVLHTATSVALLQAPIVLSPAPSGETEVTDHVADKLPCALTTIRQPMPKQRPYVPP